MSATALATQLALAYATQRSAAFEEWITRNKARLYDGAKEFDELNGTAPYRLAMEQHGSASVPNHMTRNAMGLVMRAELVDFERRNNLMPIASLKGDLSPAKGPIATNDRFVVYFGPAVKQHLALLYTRENLEAAMLFGQDLQNVPDLQALCSKPDSLEIALTKAQLQVENQYHLPGLTPKACIKMYEFDGNQDVVVPARSLSEARRAIGGNAVSLKAVYDAAPWNRQAIADRYYAGDVVTAVKTEFPQMYTLLEQTQKILQRESDALKALGRDDTEVKLYRVNRNNIFVANDLIMKAKQAEATEIGPLTMENMLELSNMPEWVLRQQREVFVNRFNEAVQASLPQVERTQPKNEQGEHAQSPVKPGLMQRIFGGRK